MNNPTAIGLFRGPRIGLFLAACALFLAADVEAQTASYQLGNAASQEITAHGACARVTNNTGKSLFIPTNTSAEWQSFRANPPAGVAVSAACGCPASGGCSASPDGAVCVSYSAASATSPTTCSSLSTTATCSNGSWSVTPALYGSCSQNYRSCAPSGGCSTTAHGATCTTYSSSAPSGVSCSTVSRTSTCNDGTWSSSPYPYSGCTSGCAASGACSAASNGATCTTYPSSSVTYPSSCSSVSRASTCSNGAWNPAPYSYSSCSVAYTYSWDYSSWGSCSSSCGTGSQTRSVWCERSDGATVSDSYCSGTKPSSSQSCSNYSSCSYYWNYGGWSSCSASCGGGTQTRSVWCERSDGATVSDSYCGSGEPASSQSCNTQACCAWNYGQSCTSSANACGQTNTGTIQCNGACSASTPSNPPNYGSSCTSSPNSCGQTNTGTIQCNGSCSATTPSNPPNYGQSCSSSNNCGATNYGTIQCNGSCSASAPPNCQYTSPTFYCPSPGSQWLYYNGGCNSYQTNYCNISYAYALCDTGLSCSGNTRRQGNGCQGSNCSYTTIENCSNNGDICWSGNIYKAPWTCHPDYCMYSSVEYCSGSYCGGDGNVWTKSGCSGSSCNASITQYCSNGCSNGACNPSYTYSWYTSGWGSCELNYCTANSAECWGAANIWSEFRTVRCQRSDGVFVSDSYCGGGKPSVSQVCWVQCLGGDQCY